METNVYNQSGKEASKVTLPAQVFEASWNADLVHQVVVSMQSNARTNVAHTKDRSDVRGGGKKPWRQKGTGRARHGSTRSPIWAGGGVTHGPTKDRNFAKKINKKMKAKALYSTLSRKVKDGEVLFVEKLSFEAPKTAEAKKVVEALSKVAGYEKLVTKKKNTALILLVENDGVVKKSFNNFGNITVDEVRNLNALDVLSYTYVIFVDPKGTIENLESRLTVSEK